MTIKVVPIAHIPAFHSPTKDMEIDVFFVQEKFLTKQIFIYHIPNLDQWVYMLTKPLSSTRFAFLKNKLNVKIFSFEKSSP